MTSYIKFIGSGNTKSQQFLSVKSMKEIFDPLSAEDKLRYALLQSLFISYYGWLYEIRTDEFMHRYAQSLKEYISNLDLKVEGPYANLVPVLWQIIDSWYGGHWTDVPIGLIVTCVVETANFNYPPCLTYVWDGKESELDREKDNLRKIIVPYLMFRNQRTQDGYVVWNRDVCVPRFRITGYCGSAKPGYTNETAPRYTIDANKIGIGFYASFVDKQQQILNIGPTSAKSLTGIYTTLTPFLRFLAQTIHKSERTFDGLLGTIAFMNQSNDEFSQGCDNSRLFYDVTVVLNDMYRIDFTARPANRKRRDDIRIYPHDRDLLRFVRIMCELDGFKFTHRRLFLRFFEGARSSEDGRRLLAFVEKYVKGSNVGPVPAEEALAYKHSILGGLEAIQLFSQYDSGQTESGEEAGQEQAGQDSGQLDLDPDLDIEEGAAEPGLEADDTDPADAEADADTTADNEQDSDDSSPSEDDAGADEPAVEEDNSSPDGGQTADSENSDVQTGSAPEEIDASDVDGIPFKVIPEGSETVDSVLLREEIDQFITNILVNPPKQLSPQCVAALTTLQKCWVHLLTVETLVRILDRLVAIPERFKNIITQLELKKDE